MALEFNAQQRAAVECERNAVVTAGAGSGKTTALAGRFLRLVTESGVPVEKILCLTFTRKATAEMYRRIYAEMTRLSLEAEGRRRELARAAARRFSLSRIQTLDSYCAGVARIAAPRYGLSPDFSAGAARAAGLVDEEALPFVIANRNHPAIKALYRAAGPDDIARRFFAEPLKTYGLIEEPAAFLDGIKKQFIYISNTDIWNAHIEKINICLAALAESGEKKGGADAAPVSVTAEEARAYFERLETYNEYECVERARDDPLYKKMTEHALALYGFQTARLDSFHKSLRDTVKEIRRLFLPLSSLFMFCLNAGLMLSLSRLLERFQDVIIDKKRREGALSFLDVSSLARKALLEQKDIRETEKRAFSAIIIDEFQDNNGLQKDILFLLAEKPDMSHDDIPGVTGLVENKLFFVGDQKQSIYKFRGADVSVFRALQAAFSGGNYPLSANYRSSPRLIAAFNALFGGAADADGGAGRPSVFIPLPRTDAARDAFPPFEAVYEPLTAGKSGADGGGGDNPVRVCLLPAPSRRGAGGEDDDDEDSGATEQEAAFVAREIETLLQSGRKPDDIAVLLRSRAKEHIYEKYLRNANVPYANENLGGALSIDPVHDMVNMMRLAVYPTDGLCYAALLRSPFAGLSVEGTAAALAHFRRLDDAPSVPPEKKPFHPAASRALSGADRERFEAAAALYTLVREKTETLGIAELTRFLWFEAGYRYEIEWNPALAPYRELFDVLFALAVKADAESTGLSAWTDMIKSMQRSELFARAAKLGAWLDDIDVPVEREGAVSILTIHKSKGLEFPVVFICGAGSRGRREAGGDISKTKSLGLAINPPPPPEFAGLDGAKFKKNYFYETAKDEERAKDTAELRRLLYVAMTRAESRVYITGILSCKKELWDAVDERTPIRDIVNETYIYIKNMQDEKIRNGGLRVTDGDTIIHDDTFLGLLLPGLLPLSGESPARLERIPAGAVAARRRGGPGASLSRFLDAAIPLYRGAETTEPESPPSPYCSAVSFAMPDAGTFRAAPAPRFDGPARDAPFERARALFEKTEAEGRGFGPEDFGAAVHRCVEARLKNEDAALPPRCAALLDGDAEDTALEAARSVADGFFQSPLGAMAEEAAWKASELPFRMKAAAVRPPPAGAEGAAYINGVIDLVFEKDGVIYIVDFKTDRTETPEEHISQLALYRAAAGILWGKQCHAFLYYARSGHAVSIEPSAGNAD